MVGRRASPKVMKADPIPCQLQQLGEPWERERFTSLGSTIALALVEEAQVSRAEGKSIGELAPHSSAMQPRGYKYDSPTLLPPIVVGELVLLA